MILVYITNPSQDEAKKIAKHLLDKKLIVCANIFPIENMYPWKGKMTEEKEFVLLGKTSEKNYDKIVQEVELVHSYEIPCVLKIPMEANEKYENWLKENLI